MSPAANHLFNIIPDCDQLDVDVPDKNSSFRGKAIVPRKMDMA